LQQACAEWWVLRATEARVADPQAHHAPAQATRKAVTIAATRRTRRDCKDRDGAESKAVLDQTAAR
jgi:hypothetical protein